MRMSGETPKSVQGPDYVGYPGQLRVGHEMLKFPVLKLDYSSAIKVGTLSLILSVTLIWLELSSSASVSIFKLRLARLLVAYSSGALLALAGHGLQLAFENALAGPFVMGLSSGAMFGYMCFKYLSARFSNYINGWKWGLDFLSALIGSSVILLIVIYLSGPYLQGYMPVLIGLTVNMFSWAIILVILNLKPELSTAYLLGYTGGHDLRTAYILLGITLLLYLTVWLSSKLLDYLALGKAFAYNLGIDLRKAYLMVLGYSVLCTAIATYFTGIVGFLGLLVPYFLRRLTPYPNRIFIPLLLVISGLFMSISDGIANYLFYPREIPVGLTTVILGLPIFIWLVRRGGARSIIT